MAKRKKIQADGISESPVVQVTDPKTGKLLDGKAIKVVEADEPFSHIKLEDGTEISMRTNVIQVMVVFWIGGIRKAIPCTQLNLVVQ